MQLACLGGSLSSLGPATAVNESVHQSKINLREVLSGLCYKQREKLWEFEVCPFHNVTQRQVRMKSNPCPVAPIRSSSLWFSWVARRSLVPTDIPEFLAYFKAGVMTTDITGLV